MDPFSLFSPDFHVCKLLPLDRWFTWICACDAFAVGHLFPAKLCSACCSFRRCASSPFSMPSSRKDCLLRAMLSSRILNGVSRYLFFPFSHFDAKYLPWEWVVLYYSRGANLWLGLQIIRPCWVRVRALGAQVKVPGSVCLVFFVTARRPIASWKSSGLLSRVFYVWGLLNA